MALVAGTVKKWKQDAPDHWSCAFGADLVLSTWPRSMPVRDWSWECFDLRVDPDTEIARGSEATFKEAKTAAERFAEAYKRR